MAPNPLLYKGEYFFSGSGERHRPARPLYQDRNGDVASSQRLAAERLDAYFEAHHAHFDEVCLFEVRAPERQSAERLAAWARDVGLLAALNEQLRDPATPRLEGSLITRYSGALPPALRAPRPEAIIGPYAHDSQWAVAQVYARHTAKPAGLTRAAVEEAVCRERLAEQRAAARIYWHWL